MARIIGFLAVVKGIEHLCCWRQKNMRRGSEVREAYMFLQELELMKLRRLSTVGCHGYALRS